MCPVSLGSSDLFILKVTSPSLKFGSKYATGDDRYLVNQYCAFVELFFVQPMTRKRHKITVRRIWFRTNRKRHFTAESLSILLFSIWLDGKSTCEIVFVDPNKDRPRVKRINLGTYDTMPRLLVYRLVYAYNRVWFSQSAKSNVHEPGWRKRLPSPLPPGNPIIGDKKPLVARRTKEEERTHYSGPNSKHVW